MSLRDEATAQKQRSGVRCTIEILLTQMPVEDANDLRQLLPDYTVQASSLARALNNRGYRVSGPVIARHRRGDCNCEPR